jgi:hypothetical protein
MEMLLTHPPTQVDRKFLEGHLITGVDKNQWRKAPRVLACIKPLF